MQKSARPVTRPHQTEAQRSSRRIKIKCEPNEVGRI